MKKEKISIFLSHSHKDQDKVRKIRDILEALECEPLIFFLKCLDDKNEQLEEFIKKEIKARSLFIYCRSENAENSNWVQKELDYIKSFDAKRLYTIDIENDFSLSLISFLQSLVQILRRNRIFFTYNSRDYETVKVLLDCLLDNGYVAHTALNADIGVNFAEYIVESIDKTMKEGIYVIVYSTNSVKSVHFKYELNYAMSQKNNDSLILPIIIDDGDDSLTFPYDSRSEDVLSIHRNPTEDDLKMLLNSINKLSKI